MPGFAALRRILADGRGGVVFNTGLFAHGEEMGIYGYDGTHAHRHTLSPSENTSRPSVKQDLAA